MATNTTIGDEDIVTMTSASEGEEALAVAHVTAPVADLHGFITPFDAAEEEWSEYVEQLEQYFMAVPNDITALAK